MKRYAWLVLALVACGDSRVDDVLALSGDVANGAEVYDSSCAICHGDDGQGDIGSDLTTVVPTLSDEEIVEILLDGISGTTMPAFSEALDDQAIADVLAYIRGGIGE